MTSRQDIETVAKKMPVIPDIRQILPDDVPLVLSGPDSADGLISSSRITRTAKLRTAIFQGERYGRDTRFTRRVVLTRDPAHGRLNKNGEDRSMVFPT